MNDKMQTTFENDASELTVLLEYINLTSTSEDNENEPNVATLTKFSNFDNEEPRSRRDYLPIPVYTVASPDITKFKKYLKIEQLTSVSTDCMQMNSRSAKSDESFLKVSDNFSKKFLEKSFAPTTNFSIAFNNEESILVDNLVLDTVKVECLSDEEQPVSPVPANSPNNLVENTQKTKSDSSSCLRETVEKSTNAKNPAHYNSVDLVSTENALAKTRPLNKEIKEAEHNDNSESNKKKKFLFPVRRTRAKPTPIVEDSPMTRVGKRRAVLPSDLRLKKTLQSHQNVLEHTRISPKTPTSQPFADKTISPSKETSSSNAHVRTMTRRVDQNISIESTETRMLPGTYSHAGSSMPCSTERRKIETGMESVGDSLSSCSENTNNNFMCHRTDENMMNSESFEVAVSEEQGINSSTLHTNLIESRKQKLSEINKKSVITPHHYKRVSEKWSSTEYPEISNSTIVQNQEIKEKKTRNLKRKSSNESLQINEEKSSRKSNVTVVVQPNTKTVENRYEPTTVQQRVNLQQKNSIIETVSEQSANLLRTEGSAKPIFPMHKVNTIQNRNSVKLSEVPKNINNVHSRNSVEPTVPHREVNIIHTQCSTERQVLQQSPSNCSLVKSITVSNQEGISAQRNSIVSRAQEIGTKQGSPLSPTAEKIVSPFPEIEKLRLKSTFQDIVVEPMLILQYLEYVNVSSSYFGCFEKAFKEIVAEAKSRSSSIEGLLSFLTEWDHIVVLQSCFQLLNLTSCQFLTDDKHFQIKLALKSLESLLLMLKRKGNNEKFVDLKRFALATYQKKSDEILSLLRMFIKYKNCEIPHETELANICKKIIAYQDEVSNIESKNSEVLSGNLTERSTSNTENQNLNRESLQTTLYSENNFLPSQNTCDATPKSYPGLTTISEIATTNVDTTNNFYTSATSNSHVVTTNKHLATASSHMKLNTPFTASSSIKTKITVPPVLSALPPNSNTSNTVESSLDKTHNACNKSAMKNNLSSLPCLKKEDIEKLVNNFSGLPKEFQEEIAKYLTCLEVTESQYVNTLRKRLPK